MAGMVRETVSSRKIASPRRTGRPISNLFLVMSSKADDENQQIGELIAK
jgi:hypothetical protein